MPLPRYRYSALPMARKTHTMPIPSAFFRNHAYPPPRIVEQPPSDAEVSANISSNHQRISPIDVYRQTG